MFDDAFLTYILENRKLKKFYKRFSWIELLKPIDKAYRILGSRGVFIAFRVKHLWWLSFFQEIVKTSKAVQ